MKQELAFSHYQIAIKKSHKAHSRHRRSRRELRLRFFDTIICASHYIEPTTRVRTFSRGMNKRIVLLFTYENGGG